MEVLRLTDVRHDYGDGPVLAGVSLTVAAGECLVLLGENGTGKSTLLRVAAGRERPTSGEALFLGRPADENSRAFRENVATVLEAGSCYPDLTVREHLTLVALAHGLGDAADDAVTRALEEHRLTHRADARASRLSAGQAQLLALASAWVRPRTALILDEPEQHLDTRARVELAGRLLVAAAEGTAVLLATHDRDLATEVGDRAFTVDGGRLVSCPLVLAGERAP